MIWILRCLNMNSGSCLTESQVPYFSQYKIRSYINCCSKRCNRAYFQGMSYFSHVQQSTFIYSYKNYLYSNAVPSSSETSLELSKPRILVIPLPMEPLTPQLSRPAVGFPQRGTPGPARS